jgi:mRNA-degrading endonuclease HigB of HigAB toxin-antitoxin module
VPIIRRKKLLQADRENPGHGSTSLLTEIFYEDQTILVRHVLTHAEYDKGNWKK